MSNARERYNKGLITLHELAEEDPVMAVSEMTNEYNRILARLHERITALEIQFDAIVDMLRDQE